ncbi:MAG: GIY-YIG nuclease family protein [Dehalococcoidia bacterium]|nr:GIY-YIG nuclease family protein [Dehalococcoidia bacterium]
MPSNERRTALRREVTANVPESPGVYTWTGAAGETLYIGKSRNLRRRMLSYLSPRATAIDSRTRHLGYAIESFSWRPAAGELMALLLEDALIKEHRPRHNERQRDYLERRYLLLTHDPFPACLVVEGEGARAGTLFGPFKDRYFVADLIELVTEWFGLRACAEPVPSRQSARYDLGQCPGPCRGAITVEAYGRRVALARAFLEGEELWLGRRIADAMEEAAAALRYERAAELRETLGMVARFCERQRFLGRFRAGDIVVEEPAFGLTYRFARGAVAEVRAASGDAIVVPAELAAPPADPSFVLDRGNVVFGWRGQHAKAGAAPGAR